MAQGCSVKEIADFLRLPIHKGCRDIDSVSQGSVAAQVRQRCALPRTAFQPTELAVKLMDPRWLHSRGWPRFRYCPICLAERQTPYFNIHWRFFDVNVCLVHGCDMHDRCFQCRSSIGAPLNVFSSHAGRAGFASQRRCQKCSCDLARAPARWADRCWPWFAGFELELLTFDQLLPTEVPSSIRDFAFALHGTTDRSRKAPPHVRR